MHTAMPTLVLAVDQSFWMMSSVPHVLASYLSAIAGQSYPTAVSTLRMLVLLVKVCSEYVYLHSVNSTYVKTECRYNSKFIQLIYIYTIILFIQLLAQMGS